MVVVKDQAKTKEKVGIIRNVIGSESRHFDEDERIKSADMRRVYKFLKEKYNEEYALTFVFTMRTAVELHRAWHMTLLTSKILEQIKEKFGLKMTWELGVVRLKFRVDDGGHELNRKVPYDYDSEYQDIYMRIAVALVDGHINVYEALDYQDETLKGTHTAKSGLFLRDFPGRLLLYPAESATCAMIFFGGDQTDAGIAALCGLAAGLVDMTLSKLDGHFKEFKILIDIFVGIVTGLIGGLFHQHLADGVCLKSIFLGTLYWFFYGTAFVVGILEIIAGELQTGVTRFVAVSVKTFVLSLGAGIGLMIATSSDASKAWEESTQSKCGVIILDEQWWRIPLYLLCSVSVLGQYRAPIVQYWRGLVVMLSAYEVQYQFFKFQEQLHELDNLDTSTSNILGAMAGVFSAYVLCSFVNGVKIFYNSRLLQLEDKKNTIFGNFLFKIMQLSVKFGECLNIGRHNDFLKLQFQPKIINQYAELNNPDNQRERMEISNLEKNLILETIVGMQELNIWSILMPALYQLVPGSIIATLWFNAIFPPKYDPNNPLDSVFSTLMVISTSLALGLIFGFALVQVTGAALWTLFGSKLPYDEKMSSLSRLAGMYSSPVTIHDDPEPEMKVAEELEPPVVGDDKEDTSNVPLTSANLEVTENQAEPKSEPGLTLTLKGDVIETEIKEEIEPKPITGANQV